MKTGPFADQRPWFVVAVTGHPDAVPDGYWMYSVLGRDSLSHPGAPEIRNYLDAVLCRRRDTHRVSVVCRGGSDGVDETVRAYCDKRGIPCLPIALQRDVWGAAAPYRRDLELLLRAHALVWFGPRPDPHDAGPDLVSLAALLGIPYRVVPLDAQPISDATRSARASDFSA